MTVAARPIKQPALNLANIKDIRKFRGENQHVFWSRYGLTQTSGSKYETGRKIPLPLSILIMMHLQGTITEKDIEMVKKQVKVKKTATKKPV